MALFGSQKKTETTLKKVRPTVIRTQNVAKELQNLAKAYDIRMESLDFNLLDVQTYTRMNDGTKETDWKEVSESALHELDDQTALLNPYFQIKQMYEIEIFSKNEEDSYAHFDLSVGANATKCKIYLSIKQGSKFEYHPRLEQELLILINKKKIRAGILINIFDEMLESVVSKISAHARVQGTTIYDANETLLIAQSHEPTPTTDDALFLHFDKKEAVDEHKKVNYAARGFIKSVYQNEVLIEYIKPKEGKPGRNCRGEFISPKEPVVKYIPTFSVNDTIQVVETENSIEYIAKENGYIALESGVYAIKTDVDIGEVSFRTTGSISSGLDSDVSISVKEKDSLKDAIGTGMEVEVTEIEIDGNIGSSAKVTAHKANIGGQTHKTSMVRADDLNINIHKGSAFGKNIHITRLEHGTVDGDYIAISQALGGEIRGREIRLEVCASYVKATASKLIEIKKLHGSENIFTIDPLLKKDAKEGLDENQDNIKQLRIDLKKMQQEIDKYTSVIQENTSSFNDVKRRLLQYQKNGVKMPESFVKKYKQFKKMQEHLAGITNELEQKNSKLQLLSTKTVSFQENIFDARIINRDRWVGHNELRFKLVKPPIEITYKPQEGSLEKIFGLVEIEEGIYEIQALRE